MVDLRQYLPTIYDNNIHMHAVTDGDESVLNEGISVVEQ